MDFLGRLKNLFMVGAITYFMKTWMAPWAAIEEEFGVDDRSLQVHMCWLLSGSNINGICLLK